ncbi:MAG: translation initiation factor IF-2 [Luteibaculaceae bacterium]|jgi:translation initiation factor IF-2
MSDSKPVRISKVLKDCNIGLESLNEFLEKNGKESVSGNSKIETDVYRQVVSEFATDKEVKERAQSVSLPKMARETVAIDSVIESEVVKKKEEEVAAAAAAEAQKAPVVETPKPVVVEEKKPEPKVEAPVETPVEIQAETVAPKAEKPVAKEEPKAEAKTEVKTEVKAEVKVELKAESPKAEKPVAKEEPKTEVKAEVKKEAPKAEEKKDGPKVSVVGKVDVSEFRKGKRAQIPEDMKNKSKGDVVKANITKTKEQIDEESIKSQAPKVEAKPAKAEKPRKEEPEMIKTQFTKLTGPTVIGKIELPVDKRREKKPVASSSDSGVGKKKRKRKRLPEPGGKPATGAPNAGGPNRGPGGPPNRAAGPNRGPAGPNRGPGGPNRPAPRGGRRGEDKPALDAKEIQKEIKDTLARLSGSGKSKAAKHRRAKRDERSVQSQREIDSQEELAKVLEVTEYVTVAEMSNLMDVQVNDVISVCMSLGIFAAINQRLDAETLTIIADEFGFQLEFISADTQDTEADMDIADAEEDLLPRAPIVTVMGHVDHGKTSLLDHIRNENVIGGEAGGITQHIGAYNVTLKDGKQIAFLDTPGHEAFTAMRARGAQVTDLAIIVIAADDAVMPQTKEAINHAQAAGVPMIFAINKIDKPGANPDRVREQLSAMNILVEDWGGKHQCQEVSAKSGLQVDLLLEKVLLEAELLELKANPNRHAQGTVIESALDKGRGFVTSMMVQKGQLKIGDMLLAGCHAGKVKAIMNERNKPIDVAGPSTPVTILGLSGAPNAGDTFTVMTDEREAKAIATKRLQLQREQGIRAQKHITLDEIGRRLAIGDFKELNIIIKGDVDGSIEALSDSLMKLSTEAIQVNIIHKAVGPITESDVLLASASDAIIVGFQVRPVATARKLAEKESIEIRLYSVIYKAIEEIRDAMEGMLSPDIEERIIGNIEIRETFKISKVGTIAGCFVTDGKIMRNSKIRLIRESIVVYEGNLGALKRFKDDVKEVKKGYECGLSIDKFNDMKEGDVIEVYEEVEVKKTL